MRILTWIISEAIILAITLVALWVAYSMIAPFLEDWLERIERMLSL